MKALFPDLREQLGDVAGELARDNPRQSVFRAKSHRWRRSAPVIAALCLGAGSVATAAAYTFWSPNPGTTSDGRARQVVDDPPPSKGVEQFAIFRRPQVSSDRSEQAAAAIREAGGPIYVRTAFVRRLRTPDGFEAFVIPVGETKVASDDDQLCLWVRRTRAPNGGTLCVSWPEAITGQLHLSLAPQMDPEAEKARAADRRRVQADLERRNVPEDLTSDKGVERFLPSETEMTVLGLAPDAATAVEVNGERADLTSNSFHANTQEGGGVTVALQR